MPPPKTPLSPNPITSRTLVPLLRENKTIMHRLKNLYKQIFHKKTRHYWETHHCFLVPSQCKIDRKANHLARAKLSPAKKRFVAKFCTSCLGVGHAMKYRGFQEHSDCPCCGANNEKASHVLLCPDKKTKKNFNKVIKKVLIPVLKSTNTEAKLFAAILDIIYKWKSSRPIIATLYSTLFGLQEVIKDQLEGLGWSNLMLGRWSPKWQKVQKKYLTSIRS